MFQAKLKHHIYMSLLFGISFWFHFCSSYNNDIFHIHLSHPPLSWVQTPLSPEGPVVWRPISPNPGLNFYPCFFFPFVQKHFSGQLSRFFWSIKSSTLGARDFISTVSGFCQVFIVTRCSWLRPSGNTWEKPLVPRVQIIKLWTKRIKLTFTSELKFCTNSGLSGPCFEQPSPEFFPGL